jgi:membrane-associated phospholipid phosphatase
MKKTIKNHELLLLVLFASLITLFVSTYLARSQHLVWGESAILHFFYQEPSNWTSFWLIVTTLGSLWVVVWLTVLTMVFGYHFLALRLVLAGSGAIVLVSIAKQLVGRPRPLDLISGIVPRSLDGLGYGFPSGHTAVATALAITLWPVVTKKYRWLLGLWVLMVAVSRMYLGVHAPLDIVGGISIGCIVGISLLLVIRPKEKQKRKLLAKRSARA